MAYDLELRIEDITRVQMELILQLIKDMVESSNGSVSGGFVEVNGEEGSDVREEA